ncbi:2Fe-2S iron-sulfur cluster-binding protein [Chamaesiphon minutus]|uniref:Ferredoxin, (2Fe-2S) n=1 Tax=Chamaesiphon minutus (strain ATCC 27169 / PCC 6605) TaxID=1173020 RepID=K9UH21_CHAP6|nr:2Fe-2S iron-sulfur cluster-binding protein [Chamaesiphon minutus]AFY93504.1 ferredoxin, (2Fe-2S) [Chamaesiphon minutus PCC 6605]
MASSYQVRLYNQAEGIDKTFEVPDATSILETAEEQGMELPYSCRQGICSTCTVKTILQGRGYANEGEVDQSEGSALSEEQIAQGYVLICIAHPLSNCVFETHKEVEVLN